MSAAYDDSEVIAVCALRLEARAFMAVMDQANWDRNAQAAGRLGELSGDINVYSTGRIGSHNVVLAHMPNIGKVPASITASHLRRSFRNIRLVLLVGICGGVPGELNNIMLGDVVVAKEVIEYDDGARIDGRFENVDDLEDGLGGQSLGLRGFIRDLEAGAHILTENTSQHLASTLARLDSPITDGLVDNLYRSDYWHIHQNPRSCAARQCQNNRGMCVEASRASCEEVGCDRSGLVRQSRRKRRPDIHFGPIASGDMVLRSGAERDRIARRGGAIAFDMEAAGLWNYLPCITVKGVCDYADSHKNKRWQNYAALTAAACAIAIVEAW
ncbi:5'-methylthioadenosine/S-adenosylhomocysteine nucleosidase [Drechslerella dactyloides]|uniref:5'-methylthioadenosine/S-adenosylhomocysteine nucleosidase n=1 Tax=Drechslerella dactyloides TaxID=74499 RepID=A0AAD6IW97_DREDA|nr:5'-methylthioadenosine/S-adenosylhomocysteine nucleosidase [Drechslerella dactyloides]